MYDFRTMKTKQKHIAVADDEKMILRAVSITLRRAGYVVSSVGTGTDLITIVLSSRSTDCPVDLILCDFNMPDKTGLQVMEELDIRTLKIPLVLMTGLSSDEVRAALKDEGNAYFLFKPFEPKELIDMVTRVFKEIDDSRCKVA
jgi:CheY-like chemotaxis protein